MSRLVEFLENMGRDADLTAEFENDPEAVMSRFGLSDEEKEAVRNKDVDSVKRLSGLHNIRLTNSNISTYE